MSYKVWIVKDHLGEAGKERFDTFEDAWKYIKDFKAKFSPYRTQYSMSYGSFGEKSHTMPKNLEQFDDWSISQIEV